METLPEKKVTMLIVGNQRDTEEYMLKLADWFGFLCDCTIVFSYESAISVLENHTVGIVLFAGFGEQMATAIKYKFPNFLVCLMTNDPTVVSSDMRVHCIEKSDEKNLILPAIMGLWLYEQRDRGLLPPLSQYGNIIEVCRRQPDFGLDAQSMRLRDSPSVNFLSSICRNPRNPNQYTLYPALGSGCRARCRMCLIGKMRNPTEFTTAEIVGQIPRLLSSFRCYGYSSLKDKLSIKYLEGNDPIYCSKALCGAVKIIDNTDDIRARHTICTIGSRKVLTELATELDGHEAELQLSIHSTEYLIRKWLIPASKGEQLKPMIDIISNYSVKTGNRVACRQMVVNGLYHFEREADRMEKLLAGTPLEVKVMPILDGSLPEFPKKVTKEDCETFARLLRERDLNASSIEHIGQSFGVKMGMQIPVSKRKEIREYL